jgi:hypothetical protein
VNHATKPAIRATPATPPATPPAIAPAFELLLDDDNAGEDVPGVIVERLLVELGTLEALPVTSGESVIEPISTVHKRCGSLALGTNTYRRHFAPMMHSINRTAGAMRNDENEECLTSGSYCSWVDGRPKRYSCRRWDGVREAEG